MGNLGGLLSRLLQLFLFLHHVPVLNRVEDLAALLTLHKFSVLIARDHSNLRVFALCGGGFDGRNGEIFTRTGGRVNPVIPRNFA